MAEYLVIQGARFGDLVQTGRLMLALASLGNVHLCLDKSLVKLASILYPMAVLHGINFHGKPDEASLLQNQQIFAALRGINFERVFNCNYSPLTAAICRLFPEDKVIGNRPAHAFDGGILRSSWNRLAFQLNRMRAYTPLNLVDYWGYFAPVSAEPEKVNPVAKPGGRGIGVAIAGRESRRSLPAPVLGPILETAFRLFNKPPIKLLGSEAEYPAANRLLKYLSKDAFSRVENLCGKTDLASLCDELRDMDLLLTPDTGIMHLGARLGVPVMAFFLSSALCHETGPYGKGHIVWQASISCSPCRESVPCPNNVACLEPFSSPDFNRYLAKSLAKCNAPLDLPQSLQCWKTDIDDFGAICQLAGGQDIHAPMRRNIRSLLRSHILRDCGSINPASEPEKTYANLVAALYPDEEWMLPPWRYC